MYSIYIEYDKDRKQDRLVCKTDGEVVFICYDLDTISQAINHGVYIKS